MRCAQVPSMPTAGPAELSAEEFRTAYGEAVQGFCGTVRSLLGRYMGYECKEPETGKFTLAFSTLPEALAFAVTLQAELLQAPCDERLVRHLPACREVRKSSAAAPLAPPHGFALDPRLRRDWFGLGRRRRRTAVCCSVGCVRLWVLRSEGLPSRSRYHPRGERTTSGHCRTSKQPHPLP